MKIKKIIAAVAAAAIAVSAMAINVFAGNITIAEGTAVIGFGNTDWTVSCWGKGAEDTADISTVCTPVEITGNGTYTLKVDLGTPTTGIGAMGINYKSTDKAVGFDVTSVKFDGVDLPLIGSSYTNDEDGGRRTNIINPWAGFDAAKEDYVSLNPDNAKGAIVDPASVTDWTTCEITFTVYGMAQDAAAAGDAATTDAAPAADTTTAAATTGNAAAITIVSVMALAATAAIASKKRK